MKNIDQIINSLFWLMMSFIVIVIIIGTTIAGIKQTDKTNKELVSTSMDIGKLLYENSALELIKEKDTANIIEIEALYIKKKDSIINKLYK